MNVVKEMEGVCPVSSSDGSDYRWVREAVVAYEGPLVMYTSRLMNGDIESARDVVQETFLKLCRADRAEVSDHLAAWLYTVCRNGAMDRLRKEKRMRSLTDKRLRVEACDASGPADRVSMAEGVDRILALLAGLPANQQEVIRLKFQHGMSYRQIAEVTDLSVSNVGFLLHTGLKRLRVLMGQEATTA